MEKIKSYWKLPDVQKDIAAFSEDYKTFLDRSKTERMAVAEIMRIAEKAGYNNLDDVEKLGRGDRVYVNNKGKSIMLFDIGENPEKGMAIIASHIDSPRLDVKPNPLYEENNVALLKTHYYGGIKKYQWTAIPLAIHGVMFRKDGTKVDVHVGSDPEDPIFTITDLLPHLSKSQNSKTLAEGMIGEK